jgi:hypothetical protein
LTARDGYRKPTTDADLRSAAVPAKLTLVVLLFIDPERRDDFDRFESAAARSMSRYGGRIERRISFPATDGVSDPHEVHVVTFPDRESFARYRDDGDLRSLAALRESAIRRTVVWEGVDVTPFET